MDKTCQYCGNPNPILICPVCLSGKQHDLLNGIEQKLLDTKSTEFEIREKILLKEIDGLTKLCYRAMYERDYLKDELKKYEKQS